MHALKVIKKLYCRACLQVRMDVRGDLPRRQEGRPPVAAGLRVGLQGVLGGVGRAEELQ